LLSGNGVAHINEVTLRQTRLVLGWVTVSGSIPGAVHLSRYVTSQPPRSTQPAHPFVGRRNEYQSKGGDALRLESKSRYRPIVRVWVAGKTACEAHCYTRGISERFRDKEHIIKRYKNSSVYLFTLCQVRQNQGCSIWESPAGFRVEPEGERSWNFSRTIFLP